MSETGGMILIYFASALSAIAAMVTFEWWLHERTLRIIQQDMLELVERAISRLAATKARGRKSDPQA